MRALEEGGNAVDAALTAAAVLTVAEPPLTGIGGDAFAQLWWDGELVGLNGSGRSPARLDGGGVDSYGPRSVTVPGAVAAWSDLAARFGRLGLDRCLAPAIDLAESGLAATPRVAQLWRHAEQEGRAPVPAPAIGAVYRLPELAGTLRRIAGEGPGAFYTGPVAEAIAEASWLSEQDLAAHRSEWVEPLRVGYRGLEVCELPPNGPSSRPPSSSIPGMIVWNGRRPGRSSFGCPGSSSKPDPRLWSTTPVSPATTPEPKCSARLWMKDTAFRSSSTQHR